MNRIQFRNHNAVPLTPNIEEYKQKNKSKSKRKNGTTQPTNPPTPKLVKSNIQQKIIVDRHHPISALQESIQQIPFCVNHPDRKASTSTDESLNRKYCSKCLQNNEQFSLDEESTCDIIKSATRRGV